MKKKFNLFLSKVLVLFTHPMASMFTILLTLLIIAKILETSFVSFIIISSLIYITYRSLRMQQLALVGHGVFKEVTKIFHVPKKLLAQYVLNISLATLFIVFSPNNEQMPSWLFLWLSGYIICNIVSLINWFTDMHDATYYANKDIERKKLQRKKLAPLEINEKIKEMQSKGYFGD